VVSKAPLESNLGVGEMYLILEIAYVFLWLNTSLRLDLESE